ncbi:MAG TPA: TolC family protein [Flavitalea sp.]|nr:TolC family protein [Flavitalea sp.]
MYKLILIAVCLHLTIGSMAQIRSRTNSVRVSIDTARTSDVREKLVQLALQNPEFEIADRNVAIAHYQLNAAKGDWLGFIQPTLNLNELTLQPKRDNQIFLPLYNVGVALPLNFFSQRKNGVKVAREKIFIAEAEKNERYKRIRREVLTAYEDYLMYRNMLDIQNRLTQDQRLEYLQAEKDFEDAQIDQSVFKKASDAYGAMQLRTEEMKRNLSVAKYILEELTGANIDDVLGKR